MIVTMAAAMAVMTAMITMTMTMTATTAATATGTAGLTTIGATARLGAPPGLERKNNGCQAPGQARKGDLYNNQYGPVPTTYGQRYRDTSRYFYRHNDGRIYQIDRRTNLVVNVTSAPRRR